MLVNRDVNYLHYAPTHPELLARRQSQTAIIFGKRFDIIYMEYCNAYHSSPLMKEKSKRRFSKFLRDNANYLPYRRSWRHHWYRLLRSRPDVMDADLYYHSVECCATKHIIELSLQLLTTPPSLEYTTYTDIDARVCDYILGRWPLMSTTSSFSCPHYGSFCSYGIFRYAF